MAILAVFFAGLVKLWWNTRLMKKQAVLDEEKKARVEEMRRTGLPLKRTNEIPFGVRALQRGVEVDGIWVSRPVSPNGTTTTRVAPSVTVIDLDPDKVVEYSPDPRPVPTSAIAAEHTQKGNMRLEDTNSTDGSRPPLSHFAPQPRRPGHQLDTVLNEDTLRQLEGQPFLRPTYDVYAPNSAPKHPRNLSHTGSISSSGESMDSPPHSSRSVSGRSYTSSRSSRLYMARNVQEARIGYSSVYRQGDEQRDSFGGTMPARAQVVNGYSAIPQGDGRGYPNGMAVPEPTFGPGDLHYNRKARRVNGGFEVLPAGTFGVLHEYQGPTGGSDADIDDNSDQIIRPMRSSNKLRKKSNGHLHEDSQDPGIYDKAM
jgi:hypothetical protein